MLVGVYCTNMRDVVCPDCGRTADRIKLGSEPTRLVCGRFGCSWDGVKAEDKR